MMPAKVTLARFLQTSSAIRERSVVTYRETMGVDDIHIQDFAMMLAEVSMKNSVEDFRHEFGVFEEPEELLELCNGMLQVADLVDAKRFYYNHGLQPRPYHNRGPHPGGLPHQPRRALRVR